MPTTHHAADPLHVVISPLVMIIDNMMPYCLLSGSWLELEAHPHKRSLVHWQHHNLHQATTMATIAASLKRRRLQPCPPWPASAHRSACGMSPASRASVPHCQPWLISRPHVQSLASVQHCSCFMPSRPPLRPSLCYSPSFHGSEHTCEAQLLHDELHAGVPMPRPSRVVQTRVYNA